MVAYKEAIFIIAVGIALIDSLDEVIFGGNGFLADFSLVATIIALAYIIGSLIIWVALAIESIVLLDFLTPLETLITIFFMFIGIIGQSLSDFLFNVIKFPFSFIANLAESLGLPTSLWLDFDLVAFSAAGGLDVETMSFHLSVKALGTVQVGFTASMLGTEGGSNLYKGFDFGAVKALGIGARVRVVAGITTDDNITFSIQGLVEALFDQIKFRSDPQAVFEEILETIQELGRKIGIGG